MSIRFGEGMKIVPLLIPADIVDAATFTTYVDLDNVHWATLALHFGAITCDVPTVTLMASTAATTTSAVAIDFKYRLTGAIDTDTMGDITDATSTGVALTAAEDGKLLLIDVDPRAVANESTSTLDYRFLRAVITPAAAITACVVGGFAMLEVDHPGNVIPSSS
jgi:hypothetical protein